jgi:hypothetical protein
LLGFIAPETEAVNRNFRMLILSEPEFTSTLFLNSGELWFFTPGIVSLCGVDVHIPVLVEITELYLHKRSFRDNE